MPLSDLIIPFLIINNYLSLLECAEEKDKEISELQIQLEKYRQASQSEPNEQILQLHHEIVHLNEQTAVLHQQLKLAKSNENSLRAELSLMRKKIKKMDEEIKLYQDNNRELSDLRETVYLLSHQSETPTAEESRDIAFPFSAIPDGIVSFGGHDQWRNGMQERLPTVRFVPPDFRYDSAIIRRTPCIWIHPGYLSHKMFTRLLMMPVQPKSQCITIKHIV